MAHGERKSTSCEILVGVGIVGTLTGYLANVLIRPTRAERATADDAA